MLIAVPLIITMAVGLVLGLRLEGERDASLKLSAQHGRTAAATPAAGATASPAATASVTGPAGAANPVAPAKARRSQNPAHM
jgi:hypothetical protein